MRKYYRHDCDHDDGCDCHHKKAPATGVVGTVLGATALAGVLGGGGRRGGFLGGIFGGGCEDDCHDGHRRGYGPDPYIQQQLAKGQEAITEVHMLDKYILPLMGEVNCIKTREAVLEAKSPLENALLACCFDDKLYKATCHCIKGKDMLLPEQMCSPYHGGQTILAAYPGYPVPYPYPPYPGAYPPGRGEERREERGKDCDGRRGFYPGGDCGCGNWR